MKCDQFPSSSIMNVVTTNTICIVFLLCCTRVTCAKEAGNARKRISTRHIVFKAKEVDMSEMHNYQQQQHPFLEAMSQQEGKFINLGKDYEFDKRVRQNSNGKR